MSAANKVLAALLRASEESGGNSSANAARPERCDSRHRREGNSARRSKAGSGPGLRPSWSSGERAQHDKPTVALVSVERGCGRLSDSSGGA